MGGHQKPQAGNLENAEQNNEDERYFPKTHGTLLLM